MTLPDFNEMTLNEIREWGADLASDARQLKEIKTTLIADCKEDGILGQKGIRYDSGHSVCHNLIDILNTLIIRTE